MFGTCLQPLGRPSISLRDSQAELQVEPTDTRPPPRADLLGNPAFSIVQSDMTGNVAVRSSPSPSQKLGLHDRALTLSALPPHVAPDDPTENPHALPRGADPVRDARGARRQREGREEAHGDRGPPLAAPRAQVHPDRTRAQPGRQERGAHRQLHQGVRGHAQEVPQLCRQAPFQRPCPALLSWR